MSAQIRIAKEGDEKFAGPICYEAFAAIANAHNFPPDVPNPEIATGRLARLIGNPGFYGVVAELDGKIVGSNFLDERGSISGVGPITVDPNVQNDGIGLQLMGAVMERSDIRALAGTRLVQAGYRCRSLALYSKLGFEIREHLTCMQGRPIGEAVPGCAVRPATDRDVKSCAELCFRVHGHDRTAELRDAIRQGAASVVERATRITGYTTGIAFSGHSVAETNDDLCALIGAAREYMGPGFLVPSRNGEIMRWCFAKGLRMIQPLTLMTRGLYNEPTAPYLPSIRY
jgi:GNAT superfamily N-acetyltransferase